MYGNFSRATGTRWKNRMNIWLSVWMKNHQSYNTYKGISLINGMFSLSENFTNIIEITIKKKTWWVKKRQSVDWLYFFISQYSCPLLWPEKAVQRPRVQDKAETNPTCSRKTFNLIIYLSVKENFNGFAFSVGTRRRHNVVTTSIQRQMLYGRYINVGTTLCFCRVNPFFFTFSHDPYLQDKFCKNSEARIKITWISWRKLTRTTGGDRKGWRHRKFKRISSRFFLIDLVTEEDRYFMLNSTTIFMWVMMT